MKSRILFPVLFLALLIGAPQVMAQSNRAERKLKREMRKLEKQMKKVQELKHESGVFHFEHADVFSKDQLKELGVAKKHRAIALKEATKHRELALKQAKEAQLLARKYNKEHAHKIKEYQRKAMKDAKRAMEEQRIHFEELRDQYPDGFEFPDVEFELPEFEFDFPEMEFNFQEYTDLPELQFYRKHASDADNNMTIRSELENENVEKDYSFTVDSDASVLDLRVKGSMEQGEVKIVVTTPDGEEFQTLELSPAADVNWNQKMKLEGEQKDKYKGKWTISANGVNVEGQYSIFMRSK